MSNDFIPARGFEELANQGRRVQLPTGLWYAAFDNEEDALSFARYVGGFPRRIIANVTTRATSFWSEKQKAFLPKLSIHVPGWGREEGLVLCKDRQVAGLVLEHKTERVLLPIKPQHYITETQSGTLYIGFTDGTAFCRLKSDGPQRVANTLFFTKSRTNADIVQEHGGELEVTGTPAPDLYPLYVFDGKFKPGRNGRLAFEKGAFRLGTAVKCVTFA